ncbi:OLC1v1002460C1 [Oldenlandia corymbosa var. corymbosa]|uniref:OLC1v1002460C1 n=1 Tax=Oldenlandia corymbosa var. corymbosa TaxID=529605 RepID=A0AAV1D8F2_OLDCO|nr:OLC1v1002460C1 [Oldenlandia corymbosa var. corymbosa]
MDGYEIVKIVGEGIYGKVYEAQKRATGETVAIRETRFHENEDGVRQLYILQSICRGRYVVRLLDVKRGEIKESRTFLFLVFEYMPKHLSTFMGGFKRNIIPPGKIKTLMYLLCKGVAFCHGHGVLHRNLKPSNLLMDDQGEKLKIADIGLATDTVRIKDRLLDLKTLWYTAPEVLLGYPRDTTAMDMWSVACIFAELVRKEVLFKGKTKHSQLNEIFRILGTPNEDVWPGVSSLPDWQEFPRFKLQSLKSAVPNLGQDGLHLLTAMLKYVPSERISADDALKHWNQVGNNGGRRGGTANAGGSITKSSSPCSAYPRSCFPEGVFPPLSVLVGRTLLWFDKCVVRLAKLSNFPKKFNNNKPRNGTPLVDVLSRDDVPELQFEAALALAIIASGTSENTKLVIDEGAVPAFVKLLGSPRNDVHQMAVWTLGNIAGDSPSCRDSVLKEKALIQLLKHMNERQTLPMLRDTAFTLLNFCRGKPGPPFEQMCHALPALQLLLYFNDKDVLTYACWALSYLSDGTTKEIQAVIGAGVCPRLVELLSHQSPSVLIPALRTLRNIARGDDCQRQCIIEHRLLPSLKSLLLHGCNITIKQEACLTVSAITAGNKKQNEALVDAKLIEPLMSLLKDGESDIKEEAEQAVLNIISGGTRNGNKDFCLKGLLMSLRDLLGSSDSRIVPFCLDGLKTLCTPARETGARGYNYFAMLIFRSKGYNQIKELTSHPDLGISEKASNLYEMLSSEEKKLQKLIDDGVPIEGDLFV